MTEETLDTGAERSAQSPGPAEDPLLSLVVLWSRDDPGHLGAILPVPGTPSGSARLFGRGEALTSDQHPRLTPIRQRPGSNETLGPFEARSLSRHQLLVRASAPGELTVTNVGRARLAVNGAPVDEAVIRPGDVIELGTQLCLLCAWRPRKLSGPVPEAGHAFGESDALGMVGESPALWKLRGEIVHAAASPAHVLVLGASGTGKELVARAIHALSKPKGPLVTRNATTLPESLVDAELFGNTKGYPNAGMPERPGLVGAADQGTLFLDEFGELANGVQVHLLRLLDSGEYQRLGETTVRHARTRVVAATNRPESALRADVLARFGICIRVPDLSARLEDVPLLARSLCKRIAAAEPARSGELLTAEGEPRFGVVWIRGLVRELPPGNVRGLRNLLLGGSLELQPASTAAVDGPAGEGATPALETSDEGELKRAALQAALDANNGSIERTWRALGLANRFAMMRLVRKHDLVVRKHARKR